MARRDERIGWPTIAGLGLVVVAFMVLSVVVTAAGTSRFAVAMGYDANVGYAVGTTFDIAKGILPVALLALLARRALGTAALLERPAKKVIACLANIPRTQGVTTRTTRRAQGKTLHGSTG